MELPGILNISISEFVAQEIKLLPFSKIIAICLMKLNKTPFVNVNIVLIVISIITLSYLVVGLRRNFSQISSAQAFVNGKITFVRASIPGELELNEKIELGKQLQQGIQIGAIKSTVENPRVSVLTIEKKQLSTQLQDVQQQLSGVKQQIQNRTELMNLFKQQTDTQRTLEIDFIERQIKQYEAEKAQAQAKEKVARADAQRFASLAEEGAANVSRAENETAQAEQLSAVVQEAQSKIEQAKLSLEATKVGLQLDGTRTLNYSEIRVLELDAELTDLQQQEKNLEKQIQSIQSQLFTTNKEFKDQQTDLVLAPMTGVIWSIDSQPQEIVKANQPIIQLLDCQNLWVDAFINETDTNQLAIGQKAEINLDNSSDVQWQGQIETVRAGTGRIEVGQYVVEPPPEIASRQLPVRVATVRIKIDRQKNPRIEDFCLAGRSVNVRFLK
jgi:multidrug resistance efflux pump